MPRRTIHDPRELDPDFLRRLLKTSVCRLRLNAPDSETCFSRITTSRGPLLRLIYVRCRYLDSQRSPLSLGMSYGETMEARSLLQELDDAVSRGSPESRLRALWHATDLLIAGTYTEDQIWTFGELIGRLASEIEVAARIQLAKRLARTDNAPITIINKLAFDNSINVAGPILRHSERLDVRTLVENVRTKSQSHLMAISKRKSIAVPVTDELVTRGDQEVVSSVATNDGARFL